MSEQHTQTPWGFSRDDENGVEFNITSENWYVAVCCDAPGDGTPKENARRIVASVNACAGYTTEELEQATLDKRHRHEIIADLVKSNKQRDELLAALEEITNVFATIGITSGCYDDELNALQKGLSAIASVKDNTK